MEEINKTKLREIREKLKGYEAQGVKLFLRDKPRSADAIAVLLAKTQKGGCYIADYGEPNENGDIEQIHYHFVKEAKKE